MTTRTTHDETTETPLGADYAAIRELNTNYFRSFLESDVDWYDRHLRDDFTCMLSTGTIIGKAEFIQATAAGPGAGHYSLDDIHIRVYPNVALVQARTRWTETDGTSGATAYTDTYVRDEDGWRCVAAQLTAVSA